MRIAVTVDPDIPVPPKHYGGIERIVDLLVRGLIARDHEVTLFAHRASTTPAVLRPYPSTLQGRFAQLRNGAYVAGGLLSGRFDLVHSFARMATLLPVLPLGLPKLMSYQRHITPRSVQIGDALSFGRMHYSGCSAWLIGQYAGRPNWHVVYNGVPADRYKPRSVVAPDAPLVFLGRIEAIKGPHTAIEIARRSGRRLVIAGNVPVEAAAFYATEIEPHLDGEQIRYIGPVDDDQKDELLGGAAALLMPIHWDEPFGIVMAEALACGTPVLGFARGAVPEVVQDGLNGFVRTTAEELAAVVPCLERISRHACRRVLEERFSDQAIVAAYEHIYHGMVNR